MFVFSLALIVAIAPACLDAPGGGDADGGGGSGGEDGAVVLAQLEGRYAQFLAQDADFLYLVSTGTDAAEGFEVARVPKDGGAAEVMMSGEGTLAGFARAGERFYFAGSLGVYSSLEDGGDVQQLSAPAGAFHGLAADGETTVWSTDRNVFLHADGSVRAVPFSGASPQSLALIDDELFFIDAGVGTTDSVHRFALDDSAPSTLASAPDVFKLAVGGDHVVWTLGSLVQRHDRSSGEVSDLAVGLDSADEIATDGDGVYLAAFDLSAGQLDRAIFSVGTSGSVRVHHVTRAGIAQLILDAERLYWLEEQSAGSALQSVAR